MRKLMPRSSSAWKTPLKLVGSPPPEVVTIRRSGFFPDRLALVQRFSNEAVNLHQQIKQHSQIKQGVHSLRGCEASLWFSSHVRDVLARDVGRVALALVLVEAGEA